MTPDLLEVLNAADARGSEWLGDMLDVIERDGRRYFRECAQIALTCGPSRKSPAKPAGMPREVAHAIREQAYDEVLAARLYGGRR